MVFGQDVIVKLSSDTFEVIAEAKAFLIFAMDFQVYIAYNLGRNSAACAQPQGLGQRGEVPDLLEQRGTHLAFMGITVRASEVINSDRGQIRQRRLVF